MSKDLSCVSQIFLNQLTDNRFFTFCFIQAFGLVLKQASFDEQNLLEQL